MPQDSNTPEFNAKTYSIRERMNERDRMMYDVIVKHGEQRLQTTQTDYESYRGYRIRQEEDRIYGKLRVEISAPRPANAPPPRMPTIDEIRQTARAQVDRRHEKAMARIRQDIQSSLERHVDKALGPQRDRQRER